MVDYALLIGLVAAAGGGATIVLYSVMAFAPPSTMLPMEQVWGYLGRHGDAWKQVWKAGTVVSATAVSGLLGWLAFDGGASPNVHAFVGTVVMFIGIITWPVGVLRGSMRVAQVGVAVTAIGATEIVVFVAVQDSVPVVIYVAAAVTIVQFYVVDGLWALLSSRPPYSALRSSML
ncbi:MAG: hypothetical protein ACPGR8_13460 [Limisphaerales bacterium]